MAEQEIVTISKETVKRIVKDVSDIMKNPLNDEGIYYEHDSDNMLKGYALIFGPEYGLYKHGMYFFEFTFPYDYPYTPPKVKYCTNDGTTRFHPNLYRQGKVCLSILNTWRGESWTSCQSLRSILLNLLLLFNDTPILNEPGVTKTHLDYNTYHNIITYKNIVYSICNQLSNEVPESFFSLFKPTILEYYKKHTNSITEMIETLKKKYPKKKILKTGLYDMKTTIDYKKIEFPT